MKLREFSALETGDRVENAMTNGKGTVSTVRPSRTDRSVSVKWGPSGIEFSYGVHSTAWMHWNKVDDANKHPADYGLDTGDKP